MKVFKRGIISKSIMFKFFFAINYNIKKSSQKYKTYIDTVIENERGCLVAEEKYRIIIILKRVSLRHFNLYEKRKRGINPHLGLESALFALHVTRI